MKMQDPFCELQTENLHNPSKHNLPHKVVLPWAKGLLVTLYSSHCKICTTKCMHTNSKYSLTELGKIPTVFQKRNKIGAAVLQKTFHKDTLYNRRQVWAIIPFFLQITHISAAAAAAAAAEGSRELLHCITVHYILQKPKKTDNCHRGWEAVWPVSTRNGNMEGLASNADAAANISAASGCCLQSCCKRRHSCRSGPTAYMQQPPNKLTNLFKQYFILVAGDDIPTFWESLRQDRRLEKLSQGFEVLQDGLGRGVVLR